MSLTQTIARNLLPDRLFESMRAESQSWVMRCPCGAETSIWEMGGIRWKAAGEPRRMGHCGTCGRSFWGQVYRRAEPLAAPIAVPVPPQAPHQNVLHKTARQFADFAEDAGAASAVAAETAGSRNTHRHDQAMTAPGPAIELARTAAVLLWIDGVGCWMMFPGESVSIGGPVEPGSSQKAADLCVLANLRRTHATIERSGEAYRLTSVDASEPTYLRDNSEINVGGKLTMRFRVPSVLSATAVLSPTGEAWPRMFTANRTPASVDGIVLLDEVCLLGAGSDAHVPCREWDQTVILFRRQGQLWCRSQGSIEVDGAPVSEARALSNGSVVGSSAWRFRVEAVPRIA